MPTMYKDVPHLIFAEHDSQKYCKPEILDKDKTILRELGMRVAEIASLTKNKERISDWKKMSSLKKGRPMVWINEVCWNEMNVNGELDILTKTELAQRIEMDLRKQIYQFNHMPCDMVIEPVIYSPKIMSNSGIGIEVQAEIKASDADNEVVSRHFDIQIRNEDDIEKIKDPVVQYYPNETKVFFDAYHYLFDGIIDVQVRGCPGFWFAPWDDIVTFTGVQEALMDLIMRPDYIHKLVNRLTEAYIDALEQHYNLGLISSNNDNTRTGSGAFGYCDALKEKSADNDEYLLSDIWGSATPQIFSEVSPAMHREFALTYEKKWLSKFGLSYYGCCEPLHNKIEILEESIPNLRKISMSPWANGAIAGEKVKGKYVASIKTNPAVLAADSWDIELARKELKQRLNEFKDCDKEIIMKDISTVRRQPQRLWEWAKMAMEEVYNV